MARWRWVFVVLPCSALGASCDRTRADEGLDASLQVEGAQFFRGSMPTAQTGPKVRDVTIGADFTAGSVGKSCIGDLEHEATSVAIGIAGDLGYWVVRADLPSASAPDEPTFTATLGFARAMKPGPRDLVVRAVDAERHFGPPLVKTIRIADAIIPDGQLVVSLSWDNGADLDLHVVDPHGVEIFKRNPNSYEPPPPGSPSSRPEPRTTGACSISIRMRTASKMDVVPKTSCGPMHRPPVSTWCASIRCRSAESPSRAGACRRSFTGT